MPAHSIANFNTEGVNLISVSEPISLHHPLTRSNNNGDLLSNVLEQVQHNPLYVQRLCVRMRMRMRVCVCVCASETCLHWGYPRCKGVLSFRSRYQILGIGITLIIRAVRLWQKS